MCVCRWGHISFVVHSQSDPLLFLPFSLTHTFLVLPWSFKYQFCLMHTRLLYREFFFFFHSYLLDEIDL